MMTGAGTDARQGGGGDDVEAATAGSGAKA